MSYVLLIMDSETMMFYVLSGLGCILAQCCSKITIGLFGALLSATLTMLSLSCWCILCHTIVSVSEEGGLGL